MSSSKGDSTKKLSWFKSMVDRMNHQEKLYQEALRFAENPKAESRVKVSEKAVAKTRFEELLVEAKEEVSRKREHARKSDLKKKEKSVDK